MCNLEELTVDLVGLVQTENIGLCQPIAARNPVVICVSHRCLLEQEGKNRVIFNHNNHKIGV